MNWKTMKKIAVAILICNVTITSSVLLDANTYKLHKENVNFSFSTKESKQELVAKAINKNKELNDIQKEELIDLKDYILENPYLNEKYALYCLENFKLKTLSKEELRKVNAIACYNSGNNTMYINENNQNILHESLHMLGDYYIDLIELLSICKQTDQSFFECYGNILKKTPRVGLFDIKRNIGYGLNEGMTALLAHEYFNDKKDIYHEEQILSKMLCEIIGTDKMLEAYSRADIDIIIDELVKIDGDKEQAIVLMKGIERLHYMNAVFPPDENPIIMIMDKYYRAKYGISLHENKMLEAYYYQMLGIDGYYVNKGYFSGKYKEEIGEPFIIYETEIIKCKDLDSPQYCKNKTN